MQITALHKKIHGVCRVCILLILSIYILLTAGCQAPPSPTTQKQQSYRDIPGITEEQKQAIEQLRLQHDYFIYGMLQNDEAIYTADGEIIGFAAQMCNWLTQKFEIPFVPVIFDDLTSLMEAMENGDVHFTGQFPRNPELESIYRMTEPISMRTVAIVKPFGGRPLDNLVQYRAPRFAFKTGTVIHTVLQDMGVFEDFEYIFADSFYEVNQMIQNNTVDAFLGDGVFTHTIAFPYLNVEAFYPFIFGFASFSAQDPAMFPIVDVMQMALNNGAIDELGELFSNSMRDVNQHIISLLFTEEGHQFIENNPVIPIAVHGDSYPISFYNIWDGEFQGIAHDILQQVSLITGLEFEIIHRDRLEMPEIAQKLRDGEVYFALGVFSDRFEVGGTQNPFLMTDPFFTDSYAFLSATSTPTIHISELLYAQVGVLQNGVYDVMFRHLFPYHDRYVLFENVDQLVDAIEHGDVDLAFYSLRGLVRATNYFERTGIRPNFVINESYDISFALGEDMEYLQSIVNKALTVIDTQAFSDDWMTRTFDFRVRILQAQRPFLTGAVVSLVIIMLLLALLFYRAYSEKRKLEKLVKERTDSLEMESNTLNEIVDTMPDVMFYKDLNLNYVRVNKKFETLLGVERQNIIGTRDKEGLLNLPSKIIEAWNKADLAAINQKVSIRIEELVADANGELRTVDTIKTPLIHEGEVYGVLGIARDITERKEYEENLRAASVAKSAFLAHMSHEIRTPMNSIMGFSELALEVEMPAEIRQYLDRINESANSLLDIVNNILDMSKIESGKIELEKVPFDLNDIFAQCKNIVATKVQEKGLNLDINAEPISDSILILGDPVRLRQVLLNLLSNAVKFTEFGTISVKSSITKQTKTNTTILWEIKDTGIGMEKSQIESIFEPFVQADSSITRKYGGTGLGIPIIRGILDMMGSELKIESVPGVGSKFSFKLTFDTVELKDAAQKTSKALNIDKPNLKGEILVCEDSPMNQLVIGEHLQRIGLSCIIADNGKEGVELVTKRMKNGEKPFDLILMDIHMPVMDGLDATTALIKMDCPTPIVAITANVMTSDRKIYNQIGMKDCIGKPFRTQDLWSVLLKHLQPNVEGQVHTAFEEDEDIELRDMLIASFVKEYPSFNENINKSLKEGDMTTAHRLAHTLKSSAKLIKEDKLAKAAESVEATLKQDKDLTDAQLSDMIEELNIVLEKLKH